MDERQSDIPVWGSGEAPCWREIGEATVATDRCSLGTYAEPGSVLGTEGVLGNQPSPCPPRDTCSGRVRHLAGGTWRVLGVT